MWAHDAARDALMGALIGLARAEDGAACTLDAKSTLLRGLRALPEVADATTLKGLTEEAGRAKAKLSPGCATCAAPCGRTDDYDMRELYSTAEPARTLKYMLIDDLIQAAKRLDANAADAQTVDAMFAAVATIGDPLNERYLEAAIERFHRAMSNL